MSDIEELKNRFIQYLINLTLLHINIKYIHCIIKSSFSRAFCTPTNVGLYNLFYLIKNSLESTNEFFTICSIHPADSN